MKGELSMRFVLPVLLGVVMNLLSCTSSQAAGCDFGPFQELLRDCLQVGGRVDGIVCNLFDYSQVARPETRQAALLKRQLETLATCSPSSLHGREEEIAFWINVYNFDVIWQVVQQWPLESAKEMQDVRTAGKKLLRVADRLYSLKEIKSDILLGRLQEPLALFVLADGAISGPDLAGEIYRASPPRNRFSAMMIDPAQLGQRLRVQARLFLENPGKGLRIDRARETVFFSQLFTRYPQLFPAGARSALPLVIDILHDSRGADYLQHNVFRIQYLDYNWKLNSLNK